MDDYGEDATDAGLLTLGAPSTGDIEEANDKDWFGVVLEAGKNYRVKIEGAPTNDGSLEDPVLSGIFDSTETLIANTSDDDDGIGLNSELIFTPNTSETFYVEAAAFDDSTGTYNVTVEEVSATPSSQFSILGLETVKVEGDTGTTIYEFTVSRTGDTEVAASVDWAVNPFIGGDSASVDDFDGGIFPSGTVNFVADQTSHIVTIEVVGDVAVELNETFSFDLSNPSVGGSINTGSKLGTIIDDDSLGDGTALLALTQSTFTYEGQSGFTPYEFTVTRTGDTSIAAMVDWNVLAILGADTVDGDDFQGGVLPFGQIAFAADELSKVITVQVVGDSTIEEHEIFGIELSNPGAQTEIVSGGSKLFASIYDDDEDDFGVVPSEAGKQSLGTSTLGVIGQANDVDWHSIQLEAGRSYRIDLEGASTLEGTLGNPMISGIYDLLSVLQANSSDDDSGIGTNSQLDFVPDTTDTYHIAVTGAGGATGSYQLVVELDTNMPPTGEVTLSGVLEQGQTLTVSNTLADTDGLGAISYRWFAGINLIAGVITDSLLLTQELVGQVISATADYTDGLGREESVSSDESIPVANIDDDPSGSVTITGIAKQGELLTASNDIDDLDGLGPIAYQWYADGQMIAGATGQTYTPDANDIGKPITVIASYTDDFGAEESVESAATANTLTAAELIEGTPDDDSLLGGVGDDTLLGLGGNDTLEGMGGNDRLDGGDGLDHAQFQHDLIDFSILNIEGELTVTGPASNGEDTLIEIERLHFDDLSLAFDLDGNAGQIAKLLGVVLGKDNWYNRDYVGIGIDLLDNSDISIESVMDLAFGVVLGNNPSNLAVVNLIYENLVGVPASPSEAAALTADLLDSGTFTQGELGAFVLDNEFNLDNIDIVGLAANGLEYVSLG